MVKSLISKAEQGGWLPIFPAWNNYTSAMIGDHVIAMICDAHAKGIRDFDTDAAWNYMAKNAFQYNSDTVSYQLGKGRRALDSYLKYNYLPMEEKVPHSFHKQEQVSRTLEYAYDDFVLAQFAKSLGNSNEHDLLMKARQRTGKMYLTILWDLLEANLLMDHGSSPLIQMKQGHLLLLKAPLFNTPGTSRMMCMASCRPWEAKKCLSKSWTLYLRQTNTGTAMNQGIKLLICMPMQVLRGKHNKE
jgi:hypothetical protein